MNNITEKIKKRALEILNEQLPILNIIKSTYAFNYGQGKLLEVNYTMPNSLLSDDSVEAVAQELASKLIDTYIRKIEDLIKSTDCVLNISTTRIFELIDSKLDAFIILNETTLSSLRSLEFNSVPIKNKIINSFIPDNIIYLVSPESLEFNLISDEYNIYQTILLDKVDQQVITIFRSEDLKLINKSGIINISLNN